MRGFVRSLYRLILAAPLGAALLVLLVSTVQAQPGLFIAAPSTGRPLCTSIASPVTNQTWCFDGNAPYEVKVWDGSAYSSVSGSSGTQGHPATFNSAGALATGGAYLDVTQYGSWGGTATQNRAALQAAIDALPSTGGNVLLPTGQFQINCATTINVSKPLRLVGQGRSATTLIATCASTPVFTVATPSSVKFEHFTITANLTRTSGGYGIRVAGAGGTENQNSFFNNLQLDQQDVGIYCASCSSFVMLATYFTNNVSVGLLIDNVDTPDAGDSKLLGNHFIAGAGVTHIFHQAAGGLEIAGNKFSGGQNAYSLNVRNGVNTSVLQVVGNSFEDFTDHGIVMTTTGSGVYGNFTITGNEFRAVSSTGSAITLDAVTSAQLAVGVISSNVVFIDQASTRGIEVIHAQDIIVTGNTIACGSSSSTSAIYIDAVATRPALGQNYSNGCATVVENNGTLATTYSALTTLVPTGTATTETGEIRLNELRANGTDYIGLYVADSLASSIRFRLPSSDGSSGDCIVTDGSGHLSFSSSCSGGGGGGITSLNGQTGASQTFVNGANITVTSSSDQHTIAVTGQIPVTAGGTGLASGTSGGIPYFSGATTIASSGALTNHALVVGGGAGATPKTIAAMTNGQLPIGSTGADPVPATITAGTGISVTNGAGSITIANTGTTGSGAAGRCAFWSGTSTLSSDADCLYDSTAHILTVTRNASTLQTPPTDTLMVVAGASASNSYYTADAYAGQGGLVFRRANTTPAAPSALVADNPIGAVQAMGYSGAAYTSARASLGFFAKQNWTGSNQGTYMTFGLTPNNSTTFDEYARLDPDAGLRLRGPNPWTDVTAFGAKCDGTTDDTTAIQNAMNAAGAGVVHFPVGTCRFTTVAPTTGQTLLGSGRALTILKRLSGTAAMISVGRNVTSLLLMDFALDGNNADGNGLVVGDGTHGTSSNTESVIVQRVTFQNFFQDTGSTNAAMYVNAYAKITAIFDAVFSGGSVGIHVVDTLVPVYISRTVVVGAVNAGVLGAGSGFGALVFGSWFYSNRDAFVWSLNQLHIQHSYIENSTRYGVNFTGTAAVTGDLRIIDSFLTCPASGTSTLINMTGDLTPLDIHGNTLIGGNSSCAPFAFTSFPSSPTYSAMMHDNKLDNTFGAATAIPDKVVTWNNTNVQDGKVYSVSPVVINAQQGVSPPPALSGGGLLLSLTSTDNTLTRLQLVSYGASGTPGIDMGHAMGTAASPTATTDGATLYVLGAYGYEAGWSAAQGGYRVGATQDWSSGKHGTYNAMLATLNDTTTLVSEITVGGVGGLQVGSPTGGGKGAGTVNAAGAYYANGTVGVSTTITVRCDSGTATRNITYSGGIVTNVGTCL